MEIGRLLTAMVTPFDAAGQVDFAQARRLALALLDSGSEGVVAAGTTGEAPTLSHEEKLQLFAEVKAAVGKRGAVVAGTGTYNTAESIELSREAARVGVDALLLTTPYYSKPPQEGIFQHFQAIASAVSLPCIFYNIPGRTGVNVTAETMVRLAQVENIVGVKESSGDLKQISRVIEEAPAGPDGQAFKVWSGDDELTLPILSVGGYGVISVISHLVGSQIREMIQAYLSGRVEEAARIHRRLLPLVSALMSPPGNPIALKHALNGVGFNVGGYRLPLVAPDEESGRRIMAEVRRQRLDLTVAV
ncbi:MAG: 4-hydroxy-tetrahydrodipicolinate synthase [Dehalococcoidia bacterium]|nr:4-hydroxy-tetrahydrodipicolinate synthase [Dehalococcoidia bacterium]